MDQGTAITATMSFSGLEDDADTSTTDYIFRADVLDSDNGDADGCEGGGMGVDRNINQVDENPETRAGTIAAACPPGDYTLGVGISSAANEELASASVAFTIAAPASSPEGTCSESGYDPAPVGCGSGGCSHRGRVHDWTNTSSSMYATNWTPTPRCGCRSR